MDKDKTSRFKVDAEDIQKYPWQELLASHPERDCQTYYQVFGREAARLRESGDDLGERVFSFLNVVASFFPNFGSDTLPYRAQRMEADGTRTLIPDDLTDQDLDALQGIVNGIEDAEFRARVADVIWICRKDFKAAQLAVASFLESAENLKTGDLWPPYTERLDRAALISAKRGFEPQRDMVVSAVESAITEFENDPESGLLCVRLMQILLLLEVSDVDRYIALSEELAREFADQEEWDFAEHYWNVAESWHRRAKDEAALQRSMIEAAECIISRAEGELAKDHPQLGTAAHWMGRGLEALRRARGDRNRIQEVHQKFLSLQKGSLSEHSPVGLDPESMPGFKENREKSQAAAIEHVSGHDFETALLHFVHIAFPTDVEKLRETDEKSSEGLIWDKLLGATKLDRDGKVADIIPPAGFGEADPSEAAVRKRLVQSASGIMWPLTVDWRIEPARCAISGEHPVRLQDLAFLVTNNPFVPAGHERIFLRGIQAGFFGDWLVAMHLLIPQVEASFRFVLQQHGVVTSTLESDGTQNERDINQLLWDEKAMEIFGPGILFDLRGILIERFGCNMRNESAHGLMDHGAFFRAESIYLWWLLIRLCWIGFVSVHRKDVEPNEEKEAPE